MSVSNNSHHILFALLSQPNAPFCEGLVAQTVVNICQKNRIPYFFDDYKNIWVNAKNLPDLKTKKMVYVAHMDHPGFIIESFKFDSEKQSYLAFGKWMGGGPTAIKGHSVKIFYSPLRMKNRLNKNTLRVDKSQTFVGIVESTEVGPRSVRNATIRLPFVTKKTKELDDYSVDLSEGHWGACLSFNAPYEFSKQTGMVTSRAVDDLGGVASLLSALVHLKLKKTLPNNLALLISRAEEGGFFGSLGILKAKYLSPKNTAIISLEASSVIPGVEQMAGVIVRVGDRSSLFNPVMTKWIENIAKKHQIPYQRKLMDGGSCEATAFHHFGYTVAGLSLPLGGYHNVGPDQQPVVESIHIKDYDSTVALLKEIIIYYHKECGKKSSQTWLRDQQKLLDTKMKIDLLDSLKKMESMF